MIISEKIKKNQKKKIEENKAQYKKDRETAKIFAFSSGDVSKYKFSNGRDILHKKDLLEKAVAIKRFEYFPLCKAN